MMLGGFLPASSKHGAANLCAQAPACEGAVNCSPTAVYRYFDGNGRLLYVGLSATPFRRWRQHGVSAAWATEVRSITLEWFGTRREADAAEAAAIRDEQPAYNAMARSGPPSQAPLPERPSSQEFLKEIRAWCGKRGMSPSTFGMKALNDPCFVGQLEGGRECRRLTIARVRAFMQMPAEAAE